MSQLGVGDLLARSFELYRRNWRRVLALTLPIVIVVTGVTALGLGELGRPATTPRSRCATPTSTRRRPPRHGAADQLDARALGAARDPRRAGRLRPSCSRSALEAFPSVLLVVVVWCGRGRSPARSSSCSSIYLLVSWYFVVQAVVIDGDRGLAPIARSAALVRGNWWRSAGIGLCFLLIVAAPARVDRRRLRQPRELGQLLRAWSSSGEIVADALTLPFLAIGATLYYLQLRARRRRRRVTGSDRAARYGRFLPAPAHDRRRVALNFRSRPAERASPAI